MKQIKQKSNKSVGKKSVRSTGVSRKSDSASAKGRSARSPQSKKQSAKRGRSTGRSGSSRSKASRSQSRISASAKSASKLLKKVYLAERAFDFRCSEGTRTKVISVVSNNFSYAEIAVIRSVMPIVDNDPSKFKDKKGAFIRSDTNHPARPIISLRANSSEETVTHEVLHLLRTYDKERSRYSKTAYPVDRSGQVKCGVFVKYKNKVRNAEETATIAEAEIRIKGAPGSKRDVSGHWKLDNHSLGRSVCQKDRRTLRRTPSGDLKDGTNAIGKRAIEALNRNYPETLVSTKMVGR